MKTFISAFILITCFAAGVLSSENLCWGSRNKSTVPPNSTVFFENFSSQKCMRVEGLGILPNSKVVLHECLYRTTSSQDQQFQIVTNALNKTSMKMDAGRGDSYCLTLTSDNLKSTPCNPQSFVQSWSMKPVRNHPGQYLLEQYSSKKCLKPKARRTGSAIELSPCNSYETEQIWKLFYLNPSAKSNPDSITPC